MAQELLASKVRIEEVEPGVRAIPAAPTAVPGFIGVSERGPIGDQQLVTSWDEYLSVFGGYILESHLPECVDAYFKNGGARLHVVRTVHYTDPDTPASQTAVKGDVDIDSAGTAATYGTVTSSNSAPFNLASGDTLEVKVAQELLQSMGFRSFVPLVAACPGCGRTTSTTFQELAGDIQDFIRDSMPEWKRRYPGVETMTVAVMGCIVNGPGESKHADIGISLPGTGETPAAPVFVDGKKVTTLRGATVAEDFKAMVLDYIERRYGKGAMGRTAAE